MRVPSRPCLLLRRSRGEGGEGNREEMPPGEEQCRNKRGRTLIYDGKFKPLIRSQGVTIFNWNLVFSSTLNTKLIRSLLGKPAVLISLIPLRLLNCWKERNCGKECQVRFLELRGPFTGEGRFITAAAGRWADNMFLHLAL